MTKRKSKYTVVLPDMHCPDHDPGAVKWALDFVRSAGPDHLILLGDVVDFRSLSRFPKSPAQALGLAEEIKAGRALLKQIEKASGGAKVTYMGGNHEQRHVKYLWKAAPELDCLPELTVPALLEMPERWTYVPYLRSIVDQGVMVIHGERWAANTCVRNLQEYGCSVVQGHSHRATEVSRRRPDGAVLTAVEAGCLCKMDLGYTTTVNWVHALATIYNGRLVLFRR